MSLIYLTTQYLNDETKMKKKIMVTLNEAQYDRLTKSQELGDSDSEKLRNSFLIYESLKDLLEVIKKLKE